MPLEKLTDEYDAWYDRHDAAYRSELWAVRALMGSPGRALEVGVGTGRFAAPLGIGYGVDPAAEALRRARDRGVAVARGAGERLPVRSGSCDRVLINLALCFLTSSGFAVGRILQCVTRPPEEMAEPERPRPGRGDGIFVVVEALPERRSAHP